MENKVRENRLRRSAERQGKLLVKSRRRDKLAIDYGLYVLVEDIPANHEGQYGGNAAQEALARAEGQSLDAIEVTLAGASDFDVYFSDPLGDYWISSKPILEWHDAYPIGGATSPGWLLSTRADSPEEHFFPHRRNEFASVVQDARARLAAWPR